MATDTQEQGATEIPGGIWNVVAAPLTDGKLVGTVKVASLEIKDERLKGHLLSPDFFDAERYPEVVYESSSLTVNNGALTSEGTLTVKGKSPPVPAPGPFAGPALTLGDIEKVGVDLETTIDRDTVGLQWNAPLPKGGFVLGPQVTISVTLELALVDDEDKPVRVLGVVGSLRDNSHNRRLLRAAADELPPGAELVP